MDIREAIHRFVSVIDVVRGEMNDDEWREYLGAIRSIVDTLEERSNISGGGWKPDKKDI